MEKNKKILPLHNDRDHSLKSRRDFLAQGLLASAASVLMPFDAFSAECDLGAVNAIEDPMIPAIAIDLGGGGNIAGSNVIVGKSGGQLDFLADSDYRSLGLTSAEYPGSAGKISDLRGNTTNPTGLLFHSASALLQGIIATSSLSVRQKTDGIILAGNSADDTQNNPHNPLYWFYKSGARGTLTQLVGSESSRSGGRSQAPATSIELGAVPIRISAPADVSGLINLGAHAQSGEFLSNTSRMLLRTLESLTESKVKALSRRKLPVSVKDAVLCNMKKTQTLISQYTPAQVDPTLDTDITSAFNGNPGQAGSIAKMVLSGLAAAGTIHLGGFDYHGNLRSVTNTKDFEAGQLIGRLLSVAAAKGKPLVIYLFTDGGVGANGNATEVINGVTRLNFTNDSGERSSSLMLVYNPSESSLMRSSSRQMGAFKAGGSVKLDESPMSNSVTSLAKAVVLNYLALHGKEGEMANIAGDNPFKDSMDKHLFFRKIA